MNDDSKNLSENHIVKNNTEVKDHKLLEKIKILFLNFENITRIDFEALIKLNKKVLIEKNEDGTRSIPNNTEKLMQDGFLIGSVNFKELIQNENINIVVAKYKDTIVGYIIIDNSKEIRNEIRDLREDINLNKSFQRQIDLKIFSEGQEFAYLEQILVDPEFARQNIGTILLQKAIENVKIPLVSFVAEEPIKNFVSVVFHEKNRFEYVGDYEPDGVCFGFDNYKSKMFVKGITDD